MVITFVTYFSERIMLGILWVRTKNSGLMWGKKNFRNNTPNILYTVHIGDFSGPKEMYFQENYT
jgi:hypothetical protein